MFDTMTMTKIVGGFCGAFLVFLLGGFVAEFIYHPASGHGDDHHQAYTIAVEDGDDHGGEEEADAVPFAELYAAADVAAGEGEFRPCKSCHTVEDGKNGAGPHLFGIVGRAAESVDGFSYSGNLVTVAETWTPENLSAFLENPKEFAPGTKMVFRGIADAQERANLIAWLDSLDG